MQKNPSILLLTKLKALVDDNFIMATTVQFFFFFDRAENIVVKMRKCWITTISSLCFFPRFIKNRPCVVKRQMSVILHITAKHLDLYQVLAPNAYSYKEEFIPVIKKAVQSQVNEVSNVLLIFLSINSLPDRF